MEVLTTVDPELIASLRERDEFFWLDLRRPSAADLAKLGDVLGLHPLAVEDSHEWSQRPKVDTYGDHLLLVFYTADLEPSDDSLVCLTETHIYVAGGFVLTLRRAESSALDGLHKTLIPAEAEEEDYLVYQILDGLTDAFTPVLQRLGDEIDALEDAVFDRVQRGQLESIYRIKQDVQSMHRLVGPQAQAMERAGQEIARLPGLTTSSHPYLRDVVDHLTAVGTDLTRHHADLTALVDTFYNASQYRLNRIVTILTVVATFFLVWTLVTGFFGQNFGWLVDNVDTRHDFLVFGLGSLLAPTVVLAGLLWWRRRDWWQ